MDDIDRLLWGGDCSVSQEFDATLSLDTGGGVQETIHRTITAAGRSEREAKKRAKLRLILLFPGYKISKLLPR